MANGNLLVCRRNQTYKRPPKMSLRVVRQLAPGQPEFEQTLVTLGQRYENFLEVKKIGGMGLTLVEMDPLIRHIKHLDHRQVIPKDDLQQCEQEINQIFGYTQSDAYNIALANHGAPYGLFGNPRMPILGLCLEAEDSLGQLTLDREEAIGRIESFYKLGKAARKNILRDLVPHISLGAISLKNLTITEQAALRTDPNQFLADYSANGGRYESQYRVIVPETVCLNGVRAVCGPR
jgi:hypothetical protein